MNELDSFLDACALTYSPADGEERRAAAQLPAARTRELAGASLAAAAALGEAEACRAHLATQPVDGLSGPRNWPALLYLAYSRVVTGCAVEAARVLLDAGADPNAHWHWGDQYRFTALTGAFGEGEQGPVRQPPHPQSMELARLLLERGANPNDGQGLYNRMFTGDPAPLALLLEFGLLADAPANWRDGPDGAMSDLQILAFVMRWDIEHGHEERLRLALEAGVDVTQAGNQGRSAWRLAALSGQRGARRLLEQHGCEPEELEPLERLAMLLLEGDRAGAASCLAGDPGALARAQSEFELLSRAVSRESTAALELMLDLGLDPNAVDRRGIPALHHAAGAGRLAAVRRLVEAGADPSIADGAHGGTAWGWARHMGQPEARALLDELCGGSS